MSSQTNSILPRIPSCHWTCPAVAVYCFHLVFHFLPVAPLLQFYLTVAAGVRCEASGSFTRATNSRQLSLYSLPFTLTFSVWRSWANSQLAVHSQISTILERTVGQRMYLNSFWRTNTGEPSFRSHDACRNNYKRSKALFSVSCGHHHLRMILEDRIDSSEMRSHPQVNQLSRLDGWKRQMTCTIHLAPWLIVLLWIIMHYHHQHVMLLNPPL